MKRISTVGETRFKVWRLTTGEVLLETVEVEFDSPNEEWICDPRHRWGRKSTCNKYNKATGMGHCSEGYNKIKVFSDRGEAERYKEALESERLFFDRIPGTNQGTVRSL
jgi:hypothetical protein